MKQSVWLAVAPLFGGEGLSAGDNLYKYLAEGKGPCRYSAP